MLSWGTEYVVKINSYHAISGFRLILRGPAHVDSRDAIICNQRPDSCFPALPTQVTREQNTSRKANRGRLGAGVGEFTAVAQIAGRIEDGAFFLGMLNAQVHWHGRQTGGSATFLKTETNLGEVVPHFADTSSSDRVGTEAVMVLKRKQDHSSQDDNSDRSPVLIRWLIRRDMDEVLAIERGSFEFPWTEEEFLCCLRQRNCIGTVAELDHKIVGFMIYELHQSMLRILNFAVSPDHRRHAVGHQMVQRLIDKLSQQRRREIVLEVRETNLAAQMFFGACNFRALSVLRNHYDDTLEDAYYMRYSLKDSGELYKPSNRLRDYGADAA